MSMYVEKIARVLMLREVLVICVNTWRDIKGTFILMALLDHN